MLARAWRSERVLDTSVLLDFRELTRPGMFYVVWPLTRKIRF